MSSYVPEYIKTNSAKYPRTQSTKGESQDILSPFSATNATADARAFAAFMKHLREIDGVAHTVLLVQVENEIGMIPEARDRHPAADAVFAAPVPPTGG